MSKSNVKAVSAIVVCYGYSELLLETLDSIFMQDYPSIELIIAEDGSNRFQKQLVQNYIEQKSGPNIIDYKILVSNVNRGTVKNINNALASATGDYIKIIGGDDVYSDPSVFSRQINVFNCKDYYLVVGNSLECDESLDIQGEVGFGPLGVVSLTEDTQALLKYICIEDARVLSTQCICYKKRFFEKYGLFDESFMLIEDLPMAVKIAYKKVPFAYIDAPCVKHRGGTGVSTSAQAFDVHRLIYYKDLQKYYEKILMPLSDEIGKKLYLKIRMEVCRFRVKYCSTNNQIQKLMLILRYSWALIGYIIINYKRAKRYMVSLMKGKRN